MDLSVHKKRFLKNILRKVKKWKRNLDFRAMHSFFCNMFLVLLLLVLANCPSLSNAGSLVKFLPGFEGPLPFELETGYIGVGESEDVQLFYYFIKSESDPKKDPLLLWLTGGPGCSVFSGLVYEIGPINFEPVLYDGSLPKLVLSPNSWTKVASIIFLDQPVGTGFSYARTANASHSSDLHTSDQAYEFLRKWLVDHPEYLSNPVYVGGDSYAGIPVPIITQLIANGNEVGIEPKIDLQGYILGNALTTSGDFNYRIPFAHRMALISDELYQSLKANCKGEYTNPDPHNELCLQHLQTYHQLVVNINDGGILEPSCPFASPRRIEMFPQKVEGLNAPIICRMDGNKLAYYWANDQSVQDALHVRKGSISEWIRCNDDLPYTKNVINAIPYHADLSAKGYRSLIYSGDHDMMVPHLATQAWIKSLNFNVVDDWRPWSFQGQVGGYTRTYANKMTFATIKVRNPFFVDTPNGNIVSHEQFCSPAYSLSTETKTFHVEQKALINFT